MVVDIGCPYNPAGFAQDSGRAGRHELLAFSFVLNFDWDYEPAVSVKNWEYDAKLTFSEFIDTSSCRRSILGLYLDRAGYDCISHQSQPCDDCNLQIHPISHYSSNPPTHLMSSDL